MVDEYKREEVRGLLTLSVLAVLVVLRINASVFGLSDQQTIALPYTHLYLNYSVFLYIDVIIAFWLAYGVLAIVSLSDDLIPWKNVRYYFRLLSLASLVLGPLFLGAILFGLIIYAYVSVFYPSSLFIIIILVGYFVVVYILRNYSIRVSVDRKQKTLDVYSEKKKKNKSG